MAFSNRHLSCKRYDILFVRSYYGSLVESHKYRSMRVTFDDLELTSKDGTSWGGSGQRFSDFTAYAHMHRFDQTNVDARSVCGS